MDTNNTTDANADVSPDASVQGNNTESPNVAEQGKEQQKEYVTKGEMSSLLERMDGISATINRMNKNMQKVKEPEDSNQNKNIPDNSGHNKNTSEFSEKFNELEKRIAENEEREKKMKVSAISSSVKNALVKGGVDSLQADFFSKALLVELDGKLDATFDGNGYQVSYTENEGNSYAVDKYVSMFLQTDRGRALLPPKRNPSVDTPTGIGASGSKFITREDLNKIDPDDLMNGNYILKE